MLLNTSSWLAQLPEPTRTDLMSSLAQACQPGSICRRLTTREMAEALQATGHVPRPSADLVEKALRDWSIVCLAGAGGDEIRPPIIPAEHLELVELGLTVAAEAGAVFRPLTGRELWQALRRIRGLPAWALSKLADGLASMAIVAVVPRDRQPGLPATLNVGNTGIATREMREATTANACDARSATAQRTAFVGR